MSRRPLLSMPDPLLTAGDLALACARAGVPIRSCGTDIVVCDARTIGRADLATLEALARLALAARRRGQRLHLVNAPADLRASLELAGLADVVRCRR